MGASANAKQDITAKPRRAAPACLIAVLLPSSAAVASGQITHADICALLTRLTESGVDVIKTDNLCTFNGERGDALAQGQ